MGSTSLGRRERNVARGCCDTRLVPIYRLHDTTGEDLGLLDHPAPNLEPGDVVVVADGREALVTARVEAEPGWGQLVALLEVAIAPTPLTSDESIIKSNASSASRSRTFS